MEKTKKRFFATILFSLLILNLYHSIMLYGESQRGELQVKVYGLCGYGNITATLGNGTETRLILGNITLGNIRGITVNTRTVSFNINITGKYKLECHGNALIIEPSEDGVSYNTSKCIENVNPESIYVEINNITYSNVTDIQATILSAGKNSYHIPSKLLLYGRKNNTFYVPPGRCFSPPTHLIEPGSTVVFRLESGEKVILFLFTYETSPSQPGIREESSPPNTTVEEHAAKTLPPYTSSVEEKTREVNQQQLYSILFIITGIIMIGIGVTRKK